jgi:hypothetical protein
MEYTIREFFNSDMSLNEEGCEAYIRQHVVKFCLEVSSSLIEMLGRIVIAKFSDKCAQSFESLTFT